MSKITSVLTYACLVFGALIILPWDAGVVPGPMLRSTDRTPADGPEETATHMRTVVRFPCSGVTCQAWLYMPTNTDEGKPPVVIAAHGVGLQKDFLLQHYGDRFAKGGFASFIFDYRTFGGSDGEPRHWVSPTGHLQDYESAVVYIKQELADQVDVNRINLWGVSLSAGHVLQLAGTSLRDNITSVVVQVPFSDGPSFLLSNLWRRPVVFMRAFFAGIHDALRGLFSYPPAYIPLIGARGSFSLLDLEPEELKLAYAILPSKRLGGWRNMVRARIVLDGLFYRPIKHIPNIRAPVLYLPGTQDPLFSLESVQHALNMTADGQLFSTRTSHFGSLQGVAFPYIIQHTLSFLREKNGMKRIIMSSAEAAGLGRRQPDMAHKGTDPGASDPIKEEREEILATAAEL